MGDVALHSSLWTDCRFAYCPSLGNTGPNVYELVNGRSAAISNYVASAWVYDSGIPTVENTEAGTNTNRASFWTNLAIPNNVASYSLWIYSAGQATALGCPITSGLQGTTFRMNVSTAGVVSTSWSNGVLVRTAPSALSANTWTHVVSQRTRGGNAVELWIDGQLVDSAATGSTTNSSDSTVISVLARNDSGSFSSRFAGRVDDVRVYSRMLSPSDVRLLASQRAIAYVPRGRRFLRTAWPTGDAITGSGSATTDSAVSSASGLQTFVGVGLASTGPSSASAAGLHSIVGSATASTAGCSSSAVGGMQVVGQCAAPAGPAVSSASGSVGLVGSASPSTQSAASSAAGLVAVSGTALATTANAVSSAVGGSGLFGSAAVQLGDAVSQCAAVVASVGAGLASTSCQSSANGFVSGTGAGLASTDNAQASALGFVGVVGSGLSSTNALSSAAGTVTLVGLGLLTTGDAQSVAVGTIPVSGSAAVLLQSAYMVASSIAIQTDVELSAIIPVAELVAGISVPMLKATVRYDVLEGRKIWP